jgi:AcrR family transcriptional regulator
LHPPPTKRGEERRAAILEAAQRCFRRNGFHSASIASICKEAGISPGHLYHFFPSKEAIVEAIVEGDRERMKAAVAEIADQPDLIKALVHALEVIDSGSGFAFDNVLSAEIVAEAARNPRVSEILGRFDADARAELGRLLRLGQDAGQVRRDLDVEAMAGVLLVIMDGLGARTISDPKGSRRALYPLLGAMLTQRLAPDLVN